MKKDKESKGVTAVILSRNWIVEEEATRGAFCLTVEEKGDGAYSSAYIGGNISLLGEALMQMFDRNRMTYEFFRAAVESYAESLQEKEQVAPTSKFKA